MLSESQDVLDVIDRASLKAIATVPLGRRPNNLAITPDGHYVCVCIRQESWAEVVDTRNLQVINKIPVGRLPYSRDVAQAFCVVPAMSQFSRRERSQ